MLLCRVKIVLVLLIAVVNLFTFFLFGLDKRLAKKNRRRIPELQLLLLSLFGGSVGGFLAMKLFRHKTSKKSFYLKMIFIALVQFCALGYLYCRRYF